MFSPRVLVLCSGLFLVGALDCQANEPSGSTTAKSGNEGAADAGKAEEPDEDPQAEIDKAELAKHMREHQAYAKTLQLAVVRGDLDAAHKPAKWLAEHDVKAELPEILRPQLDAMQKLAANIMEDEDSVSAAQHLGAMATTCGGCHTVAGITPDFAELPDPASAKTPKAHMQRHFWAANELWQGLIGPDEMAWTRGARRLDESPLGHDELLEEAVDIPEGISEEDHEKIANLRKKVHAQSKKAMNTTSLDQRGQIYGELIGTCAPCHAIMGKGPGFEDTP